MAKRATPEGSALSLALESDGDRDVIPWDDASRTVSGVFRTNWKAADAWLRERRDDGSLGWYSVRVSGLHHTVNTITGLGAPPIQSGLYVHPGNYSTGPSLTTDRRSLQGHVAESQRRAEDRLYWIKRETLDAALADLAEAKEQKQAAEKAAKAQYAPLAAPLRALLVAAGVPAQRVHIVPPDGGLVDEPTFGISFLDKAEIEAVNALLLKAGYGEGV